MKIDGKVNIMGMQSVIFRNELSKKYKQYSEIVRYEKDGDHSNRWMRLTDKPVSDPLFRYEADIMSTIKALAKNPNVNLTFNEDTMYVDFIKKSKED